MNNQKIIEQLDYIIDTTIHLNKLFYESFVQEQQTISQQLDEINYWIKELKKENKDNNPTTEGEQNETSS